MKNSTRLLSIVALLFVIPLFLTWTGYSAVNASAATNVASSQEPFSIQYLPFVTHKLCVFESTNPMRVKPVLFVPNNLTAGAGDLPGINQAMGKVSRWYASQLGCRSFNYDPAVLVTGQHELSYYCPKTISETQCIQVPLELGADSGDIYNVLRELSGQGYKVQPGTILMIFWVGGYGYAAGSYVSSTSGWAALADWAIDVLAGEPPEVCEPWYICDADIQTGAMAHELGHAFGISHPVDDGSQPEDPDYWKNSIMEYYWNFPDAILLDSPANPQKTILRQHPFFQ